MYSHPNQVDSGKIYCRVFVKPRRKDVISEQQTTGNVLDELYSPITSSSCSSVLSR